ncbi:MAG: 2-oxoacid:acceptor oxidoreductase family protein [Deltaproteobacteria bacterium]|nr:2-oxoacid:acceptor oxidoreductase family protein [Deltaproteobacteria bacterium]
MTRDTIEIRWHGRGGQGAITAAKIVANAAFWSGFGGVVMTPTFGTERRGAAVLTSLKISRHKIYDLSPIENPDMIVVLDHLLLEEAPVSNGIKKGGLMVINTPKSPDAYPYQGIRVAVADIRALSEEAGLAKGIVNTGIIGAFAKASTLVDLEILIKAIEEEFRGKNFKENAMAARLAYKSTIIGGGLNEK